MLTTSIKRMLSIFVALSCVFLDSSDGIATKPSPDAANSSFILYLPLVKRTVLQDWIGPDGGLISAIVIDPQNPTNVFAGSWGGGVYKSIDGGVTWMRASQGLGNLIIVSMGIDPANPSILYAGTYRGKVYKSNDSGATWIYASNGIQDQAIVYSIVIDPQDTQRVYAATRGISNNNARPWAGVVYRSNDGGVTWSPSLYDLGGTSYQDWVYSLEINPNDPRIIFAATHEHGPVRSKDYGETWKVLSNGISDHSTRAIVVDPRSDYSDTVYTGVWTKSGVFKSTDGGGSWELKSDGISGANIYGMAINPFAPKTLYAATYNKGVMKTSNGAKTWSAAGLKQVGIATLRISPADGQTVFAGTAGDGLYISQDGGENWNHSQTHLAATAVTSLVVSPFDPSTYYASLDGGGVMYSQDSGLSWTPFNNNLGDLVIHALVQHPVTDTLFALSETGGLYRCNILDSFACWQEAGLNTLQTGFSGPIPGGARLPESRETFLSLFNDPLAGDPLLASQGSPPLLTMAFAPSDPNTAYIGTNGAGVYKSTDGGNSWAPTSWTNQRVWSIAIHPEDPNILFAATDQSGTIRASLDGGSSWQDIDLPGLSVYTLAIPPAQANTLLAGTSNGLYQLSEGVWTQIGMAGQTVIVLSISPNRQDLFAAGTTNGTWISPDSGRTWFPSPVELQGATIQSISFSLHNRDLIFYNTLTNGTLRAEIGY